MDWMEVAQEAEEFLRKGDLEKCEKMVEESFDKTEPSPFHLVTTQNFTNDPSEIAKNIDDFIAFQKKKFEVKAVYVETNGFDINPDEWYYDIFGYKKYGGHDDHDWLAEWDSDDYQGLVLTGMEKLQKVYENEDLSDKESGKSSLLVVIRFQQLIQKTIPLLKSRKIPILATGHDYDFIFEG
jgi:hypothetical protein